MAGQLRTLAASLTKVAAIGYDTVRRPPTGLTILAYHRVGGGTQLQLDLEPGVFDEQMAHLAASCAVLTLDDAVPGDVPSDDAGSAPARAVPEVVITFDDGTADFVEHALPILVRHRLPATYYVATAFIEEQRPFPDDGTPLSWAGLAEAVSTGLVTVGSHTHTHAVMDKLDGRQAHDELRRACELIEDRLGVAADHFAYPKGVFGGSAVEAVVAEHHRTAALANSLPNLPDSTNPLRLGRTPVQRSDSRDHFDRKAQGGLRLEGQLRERLNQFRYRRAVN